MSETTAVRPRDSVLDPDTIRATNGDLIPDPDAPRHHWRCDGNGRTRADNPDDAVALCCPVCRPPERLRRAPRRGRTRVR